MPATLPATPEQTDVVQEILARLALIETRLSEIEKRQAILRLDDVSRDLTVLSRRIETMVRHQ